VEAWFVQRFVATRPSFPSKTTALKSQAWELGAYLQLCGDFYHFLYKYNAF